MWGSVVPSRGVPGDFGAWAFCFLPPPVYWALVLGLVECRSVVKASPHRGCLAAFQVGLFCGFRVVANGSLVARELVHVSPARTGSLLHASVTIWCACCGAAWGCLISKGNKQPQLLLTLTSFLLLASLEHSMASSICIHTSFHFSKHRSRSPPRFLCIGFGSIWAGILQPPGWMQRHMGGLGAALAGRPAGCSPGTDGNRREQARVPLPHHTPNSPSREPIRVMQLGSHLRHRKPFVVWHRSLLLQIHGMLGALRGRV